MGAITVDRASEDFHRLYAYCVRDVRTELEACSRIPDLSPRELVIWQTDQKINLRGMCIDLKAVADCIAIVEQATEKYWARLRVLTLGNVQKHTEVKQTLEWMSKRGIYSASLDEDAVDELWDRKDLPEDVREVVKIRRLLSFGSVKKLWAMQSQTARDGRLRHQYAYHGAHTALWNGQGVQMANLYSGKLKTPEAVENALACIAARRLEWVEACYGDALELVADCLRSMVIAPPGYDLIAADYSAIQAVVTSCLAREQWRIDVFRTHGKIYEAQACLMTGRTLDFYAQYRKENGRHHPDRQDYGKLPVLSGDFGAWIAGWKRFGADKVLGADENIKEAILKLRASIPNIVELWGGQTRNKWNRAPDGSYEPMREECFGLEGAAVQAVKNPGTCFVHNNVRYMVMHDTLYCQPPTDDGAPIQYHEPRLAVSERPYAESHERELSYAGWNTNAQKGAPGWQRQKLYGGVLTQNVVAKMSREVQADSLMRLEDSDLYRVVQHTHDDKVAEVPEGRGSIEEFLALNNRLPAWAKFEDGTPWPIKAPGAERTKRVGKWE